MTKLWLSVMAVAACGEVKANHLPDGPVAIDASTPDGNGHGIVMVNVLDPTGNGAPAIGAPVIFIDSAQTQKVATGNDGKAMADVLPGASVSVVLDENGNPFVETILGAKPGDNLTFGDVQNPTNPSAGTFTVNFPGVSGQSYEVFGPCGETFVNGPTSTATLQMSQSCVQSKMDLVIVVNNSAGIGIGYVEAPNITFNSGGSISMDTTQIVGFSQFNANFTNLAGVGNVNLSREAPDGFGFPSSTGGQVTGQTLPLTANNSVLTANALLRTSFSEVAGDGSFQSNTQSIPGNATTFGLDVDSVLLGWFESPSVDIPSNVVTVPYDQSTTTKDDTDITFIDFEITRPPATDAGGNQFIEWLVFQATPATFTLPQLPVEIGDVNPKAGDTVNSFAIRGGAIESDGVAGYDVARQDPFAAFETTAFGNPSRLPTGTTKIRSTQSPQRGFTGHMSRK